MRQHHSFGVAGGARGVQQHCQIFSADFGRLEAAGSLRKHLLPGGSCGIRAVVEQNNPCSKAAVASVCYSFPGRLQVAGIGEKKRTATVLEKLRNLSWTECSIQRHGNAARGQSSQISRNPARTVIGKNSAAGALDIGATLL